MQILQGGEMTKRILREDNTQKKVSEYHKIEFDEVITRIHSLEDLRVQIATFFATTNLTALGIAFSIQKAGILYLAAMTMIFLFLIDRRTKGVLASYYYRGLILQNMYAPIDDETFLRIHPGNTVSKIRDILKLEDQGKRLTALSKTSRLNFKTLSFWAPFTVLILEAGTASILWQVFGWYLF